MSNVSIVPTQVLSSGVTVIVAVSGVLPLLTAVKLLILPLPFAPRPIDVLLFVQVKSTPV
jgi:hypothetical protein